VREDAIVIEEGIYTDLPRFSSERRVRKKTGDARPDLNASFLMVADNAHSSLAEFDDAFLLQLLDCLDQT
jgi:hypothetical protein